METLNFIHPGEVEISKLIASEQKQLLFSLREKLSSLTHQFQLFLLTKPGQIINLLHFYQNFLVFKERLENHLKHEQVVIRDFNKKTKKGKSSPPPVNFTNQLFLLGKPVKQLKDELSDLINHLNDLILKYKNLKNDYSRMHEFFRELESLRVFLSVHKNSLKYLLTHKLIQADAEMDFDLEPR